MCTRTHSIRTCRCHTCWREFNIQHDDQTRGFWCAGTVAPRQPLRPSALAPGPVRFRRLPCSQWNQAPCRGGAVCLRRHESQTSAEHDVSTCGSHSLLEHCQCPAGVCPCIYLCHHYATTTLTCTAPNVAVASPAPEQDRHLPSLQHWMQGCPGLHTGHGGQPQSPPLPVRQNEEP